MSREGYEGKTAELDVRSGAGPDEAWNREEGEMLLAG